MMEQFDLFERLEELENGSIFIGEYDKEANDLIIEIKHLLNWIVEEVQCDWCMIENCITVTYENMDSLFKVLMSINILEKIDDLYDNPIYEKTIISFVNILNRSILELNEKEHVFFKFYKKYGQLFIEKVSLRFSIILNDVKVNTVDTLKGLPEIELTTQKEQIKLLYDLGVIEFLQNKYPATLKKNNNQVSDLVSKILKHNKGSVQPTLNALLNDNALDKNYPKESTKTKSIIDLLNANEKS